MQDFCENMWRVQRFCDTHFLAKTTFFAKVEVFHEACRSFLRHPILACEFLSLILREKTCLVTYLGEMRIWGVNFVIFCTTGWAITKTANCVAAGQVTLSRKKCEIVWGKSARLMRNQCVVKKPLRNLETRRQKYENYEWKGFASILFWVLAFFAQDVVLYGKSRPRKQKAELSGSFFNFAHLPAPWS